MKTNQMQATIKVDTSGLRDAFASMRVDTSALSGAFASFASMRVDTSALSGAFASFASMRVETGALEKAFASIKKTQGRRTLAQQAATRIALSAGDEYLNSCISLAERFCNGQEKELAMIAYAAIVSDLCDGAAQDVCEYARRRQKSVHSGGRRSAVVVQVAKSLEKFAPLAAEVRRTGMVPAGFEDASMTLAKAISQ